MADHKIVLHLLSVGRRYRVSHEKMAVFKIEFKNSRQVLVSYLAKNLNWPVLLGCEVLSGSLKEQYTLSVLANDVTR